MRVSLLGLFFCLACLSTAIAAIKPNEHFEGTVERDGICYEYSILHYSVINGQGQEIRKAKIFEGVCGQNCMEIVYDGPINSYSGDYEDEILLGGLPMSVDGSGNGLVTVPLGQGGFFGPPSSSSCEAKFAPDYSSTLVISHIFLSGFIWE